MKHGWIDKSVCLFIHKKTSSLPHSGTTNSKLISCLFVWAWRIVLWNHAWTWKIDLFIYHSSIMGFWSDSGTKPNVPCTRQKGKITLLASVLSKPDNKYGTRRGCPLWRGFFSTKVIMLNQCSLEKQPAQTPHTEMEECVKICCSPRLLFDGSAGQGTYRTPAIMWMFSACRIHLMSGITLWKVTKTNNKIFKEM